MFFAPVRFNYYLRAFAGGSAIRLDYYMTMTNGSFAIFLDVLLSGDGRIFDTPCQYLTLSNPYFIPITL
jgi:hypothetical protein